MALDLNNPFDKVCRVLTHHDPAGMISWFLKVNGSTFRFRRWLDTRQPVSPEESDTIRDTLAHVDRLDMGGIPWALLIEFQVSPDPAMFGRALGYLSPVWLNARPDDNPGSRFELGAVIVNLTGQGNASRKSQWKEAGISLGLQPCERNLSHERIGPHLKKVEAGESTRCVLPFLVLMHGASKPAIIDRWMRQAEAEPDERRRGDLGAFARILAELTDWSQSWQDALKGWNVKTSQNVEQWKEEARGEGIAASLVTILTERFGALPESTTTAFTSQSSETLQDWVREALNSSSLDEFRQKTGV